MPLAFPVVGIGASAGGLEAIMTILRRLPPEIDLAFVVILHLAADHPSSIADLLGRATPLVVQEARDGSRVERGRVYVIPPNAAMTISQGVLRVGPRQVGLRVSKAVDEFFVSLARDQRRNAFGVVLSGADGDGTQGLRAIQRVGGITFAQDETAKVPDMPESSIDAGAADFILPPEAIADELIRLAAPMRQNPAPGLESDAGTAEPALTEDELAQVLSLLRATTGVEFGEYKVNTLRRRILRRMGLHRIREGGAFVKLLRGSPAELKSLHADILIHVTRFFRNPEAFAVLQDQVIPALREHSKDRPGEPIRVWVPGCSTGEEVYSIAICLLEAQSAEDEPPQIFGTDLSESAIAKARAGVYARDVESDITPERLQKFFVKTETGYLVSKSLRDLCVFAPHDLAHDPPFSRLDLISCRNVLIYMSAGLQKRVIPLFHYALNPDGFLCLGAAESIGSFSGLFSVVDKQWNVYEKVAGAARARVPRGPFRGASAITATTRSPAPISRTAEIDLQREAVRLLLDAYAPPGVVINERMEVLYVLGSTGPYLELPQGKAMHHLIPMAREGLRAAIFEAVRSSLEHDAPAQAPALLADEGRTLQVRVTPLGADLLARPRHRLVIFEDVGVSRADPPLRAEPPPASDTVVALDRSRQELGALSMHLQSVIEEYEAAHADAQAANEEILSSNEELQSTNEELETAKEEVDATNEELSVINDELQARIAELARLNDDHANVLASVQIPMIILSHDLRIRSFTPAAGTLFNLIDGDVGRPLRQINLGLVIPGLQGLLAGVLDTLDVHACDVQDQSGRWYTMRIRPYRTRDNRIDGVVIVLQDVDRSKRAAEQIEAARDYAEAIIATVHCPLVVLDADLRLHTANPEFYRTFAVTSELSIGRSIHEVGSHSWDVGELRKLLEEAISSDRPLLQSEIECVFPDRGARTLLASARRVLGKEGVTDRILVSLDDVTDRKTHQRLLEERGQQLIQDDARKNEFLTMLAHELRNPLAPILHAGSLLSDASESGDARAVARATAIIQRQAIQMDRLIDDLLDVARITHGKVALRKERVDLRVSVSGAVESSRPFVESRRHELQVVIAPDALLVDADPTRLEQIVGNLLNNAAKYTSPGGQIYLHTESEDGWAVVKVRDTGVGIPEHALGRIFDLFNQECPGGPGDARERGGLGIGLTVVRNLVEMHGGTIQVRSAGRDQGSEFTVRLPLATGGGAVADPGESEGCARDGRPASP